jgi:hypothetical protein
MSNNNGGQAKPPETNRPPGVIINENFTKDTGKNTTKKN